MLCAALSAALIHTSNTTSDNTRVGVMALFLYSKSTVYTGLMDSDGCLVFAAAYSPGLGKWCR
jgi:hypothetical protein